MLQGRVKDSSEGINIDEGTEHIFFDRGLSFLGHGGYETLMERD
jgi:hypothetical protein